MIKPMKCEDLKPLVDWDAADPLAHLGRWADPEQCWMEAKVDGCGVFFYFGATGNRIVSATRGLDRTANFPHLAKADYPQLSGTVLVGELVAAGENGRGYLTESTSLMVSNPGTAIATQKANGPASVYFYDIVIVQATRCADKTYDERRLLLELCIDGNPGKGVRGWTTVHPGLPVHVVRRWPAGKDAVWAALGEGYEGVVAKRRRSKYIEGAEDGAGWGKLKRIHSGDFVITGWKPGENSNAGLVGSFEISYMGPDGPVPVGHAGNFTAQMRRDVSAPDGSLLPKYYGKVIEVTAQGVGPLGKLRHCLFKRWRPDKSPDDCGRSQLDAFPRV